MATRPAGARTQSCSSRSAPAARRSCSSNRQRLSVAGAQCRAPARSGLYWLASTTAFWGGRSEDERRAQMASNSLAARPCPRPWVNGSRGLLVELLDNAAKIRPHRRAFRGQLAARHLPRTSGSPDKAAVRGTAARYSNGVQPNESTTVHRCPPGVGRSALTVMLLFASRVAPSSAASEQLPEGLQIPSGSRVASRWPSVGHSSRRSRSVRPGLRRVIRVPTSLTGVQT